MNKVTKGSIAAIIAGTAIALFNQFIRTEKYEPKSNPMNKEAK